MPQHGDLGMQWLTKYSASEGLGSFGAWRGVCIHVPNRFRSGRKGDAESAPPSILRQIEKNENEAAFLPLGKTGGGLLGPTGGASADPPSHGESMPPAWRAFLRSLPILLRRPWIVEVVEPLKGERLFGDTTALGGYCDPKTGFWNLVGWRIVDGQPKVRSMVIDKPWTAVATGRR